MNTIIHQLAMDLAKKICERAEAGELSELDVMADEILEDCKRTSVEMIQVIIAYLNESIRQDKGFRKEQGLILKEYSQGERPTTQSADHPWTNRFQPGLFL